MSVLSAAAPDDINRARPSARPQVRCRPAPSPRAQARNLLASRGVRGDAQHRALATLWWLAVSSHSDDDAAGGCAPVAVRAGLVSERLGLPEDAVAAALADLVRADLLAPAGPADGTDGIDDKAQRMRLRPLDGLGEAVAHLSRLMRVAV